MALFGGMSDSNYFSELNRSRYGLTAAVRMARARQNLGVSGVSRQFLLPALGGKVGATAGWVVTAGTNKLHATLPAGVTAGTLVLPVHGLEIGDIVTAFSLVGQIEAGGNTCTLDAALRSQTVAAADNADASVGAITQVSATADTALSAANAAKTGLAETAAVNKLLYFLITGTTAAATDIDLLGVLLTITKI